MSEPLATPSSLPKLRFPGFDATWNQGTVGEVVATITPPRKLQTSEYRLEGGYPIVDQSQSDVAGWTNDESALVEVESSLIVFGDHTCALKRVVRPFAQGADGIKILKALPGVSTDFVYQSLSNKPLVMEEYKRHFSALSIRPITWPADVAEQRKVADCLQSLDELIALETQKVDVLKRYKKGLLQQLFPAEGESLPRLRFPEFRRANEWRTLTLKDVARIGSGTTPSRSRPEYFKGGSIPWVKTMDLNNSRITHTKELVTDAAGLKINPPGSVLVAMYGGFNQIGRTGVLTMSAATNQAIAVLQPREGVIDSEYLLLWLNANVERWKIVAASSRKDANITSSDVTSFPVALPSIEEQRHLSRALYDLDSALFQLKNRLTNLHRHKAALMQQLFPAIDETEG